MVWIDEPPESAIENVCEFTGVPRNQAIARLKANNNEVDRAVSEFYDDPTSSKYTWDESAFGADRQGDSGDTGISFNIQGPDETGSYHNSAAPTRPPSRANNRSPLGRLTDLTAFQAAGAPSNVAQEDADLQRALAESAAESGIPPQESGIVGSDTTSKYFGPANRPDYEKDQWAMIPTKTEAAQVKPDVSPSARKRDPSAPAFLRSNKDSRLGALVSILHKIPMARNILLSSGKPAKSYGHNSEWWKGQSILKTEDLEALARNEEGFGTHPDFNEELHRLVAFLDSTERTYGTVDGLAETNAIDPNRGHGWGFIDYEDRLYECLAEENKDVPHFDMKPLVSTVKTQRITPKATLEEQSGQSSEDVTMGDSDGSDEGSAEQETKFSFLALPLNNNPWVNTLYDALDSIFWSHALGDESPLPAESHAAFLKTEVAEILTIRIDGSGLNKPCDVPAVLYVDRYLESRRDLAIQVQTEINKIRHLMNQEIGKWEKSLLTCKGEVGCLTEKWFGGKPHNARDCWQKLIETSEYVIERQRKSAIWRHVQGHLDQEIVPSMEDIWLLHTWSGPYELDEEEYKWKETLEQAIEVAKERLEDIDEGQERIKWRKEQCEHCLNHLSKRLTCREDEASTEFTETYITPSQPDFYRPEYWNPTHNYSLRGVATTNEITYVCTRREADLIDLDDQSESREQWWRLAYAAQDHNPVSVMKTDLESVLIAAGTESKNPLLIYATEKALEAAPLPLSDALRMFVRADNRSFQHDLAQEQTQAQSQTEGGDNRGNSSNEEATSLTTEAIRSVSFASPAKRKLSIASSNATYNSGGSRNLEMESFDGSDPFTDEDNAPRVSHQEYMSPTPQYNRLGGLVESLENCRTFENESPDMGRRELPDAIAYQGMEEMQTFNPDGMPSSKPLEMQERTGGPTPFITRPGNTESRTAPLDLMDMDIDSEHHEG
ncbi:hypothetical protein BJ170DRAFT_75636 [Xylariales sp. AK1849]|nr:hypothetical protein BJ170DRAFT_75636 [Xylariales sp. AK1849]